MTAPALPPQGSTSWYAYMQWLDQQARNGGGGGSVSAATTTTAGIVELATNTETTTGTDSTRAVTPAGVKAVADGKAATDAVEGIKVHDGTASGGARPAGFARVRWIGGTTRPTNMVTGDVWERDA